jgi:hypothetical protein
MNQQSDFDEFNYLERKRFPLDWRSPHQNNAPDCKVTVNGSEEYLVHLEVACRSSKFFFDVATGIARSQKETSFGLSSASDGDIQLKMSDGSTMRIGRVTESVTELKTQIHKTLGISEPRQRLFCRKGQESNVELDEGWRSLANYGVERGSIVMLVVREPWQCVERSADNNTKTVHLALPEACADVFETVLDYMYHFHRVAKPEYAFPYLSADRALGTLWLAGRLEMTELQEQMVNHLQQAVTVQSAPEYLSASVRLGLSKVRETATRLTAAGLDKMAPDACDGLPLEALEQLLAVAEVGGAGPAWARDRVLAAYLRAYDAAGRLDEPAYRRVIRRHSAGRGGAGVAADGGGGGSEEDQEGVAAEDALLLLDLSIRCARKSQYVSYTGSPARRARSGRFPSHRSLKAICHIHRRILRHVPRRIIVSYYPSDSDSVL